MLLRSGLGFTPTERGDSDLPELSNTIGQTAFRQGDSAHGASRYWECVGGIFNFMANRLNPQIVILMNMFIQLK